MATVEHSRLSDRRTGSPADDVRAQLERLYRVHGKRVSAICASILRDRHEAEDAAQQAFVSAFRALLRGAEPRDPAAWLATIARNESWARARRHPCVPLSPELRDVSQQDPATVAARRGELAHLWKAIESLPPSQREALLLREVRGLAYAELADDLELSRPSVRSLLTRARRTLRGQLEKGAAALTGAPWLNLVMRLLGDGSTPALSSASRTAAVGLGALAIAGGAVVAPSLTSPAHDRPAATSVRHLRPAATPAPARPVRVHVAARVVAVQPARRTVVPVRDAHRRGRRESQGGDDRHDAVSSGGARDGRSQVSVDSGSDSHGGQSASSDGGGTAAPGGSQSDGMSGGSIGSGEQTSASATGGDGGGTTSDGGGTGSADGSLSASGDTSGSSGGGGDSSGSSGSDGSSGADGS